MADLSDRTVFSPTDANNNTGTNPGWPEGMLNARLNDAARALQGALTRDWDQSHLTVTSTGSANAYTLTYAQAPAAWAAGLKFTFKTNFAVTGPATLTIAGLAGTKNIKKDVLGTMTALASGDNGSGSIMKVEYDGADVIWTNWQGAATVFPTANSTTEYLTGTDSAKFATAASAYAQWGKGAAVASAGVMTIGDGGYIHVTGTTTITDIDFTVATDGRPVEVIFDGILTLTHNGTTLQLPGAANIITAAGDRAAFRQDAGDNVICMWYTKASSAPGSSTPTQRPIVLKTSGTTYTTPAGCTQIKVEVIGGGGAGGAGTTASGGGAGGGGGGYAMKLYTVTPSTGYTYAVAAAGGSSTFTDGTTLITGAGGALGGGASGGGGAGGSGTNGDINLAGGRGQPGAASTTFANGGNGGSAGMGWGAGGGAGASGGAAGSAGAIYGGAGGGGGSTGSSGFGGGAGATGAVIITEYY